MSNLVRYLLAFGLPLVAALALTPVGARIALRLGIVDHPREHKFHSQATPYLGGVALGIGLLAVAGLTSGLSSQVATILLGAAVMAGLGLLDDWRTVRPVAKLTLEAAAGLALWIAGVRAGLFGIEVLDILLTVVWVVAVTNAVNLLDNMDGIASGVVVLSALSFFAIAAYEGDYLVASLALAVAGATLGFLRYNFPPARIFLGDAGSLMLGFLLAALGLKLDLVGESGLARSAIPALALAVPLFDMLLVVVDRARGKRPVFRGGTDHSAHRLVGRGISTRGVALLAYATQLVCSASAFWLNAASTDTVLFATAAAALVGFGAFGYLIRLDGHRPAVEVAGEAGAGGRAEAGQLQRSAR